MIPNSVDSCVLTREQRSEIGALLIKARAVVERVSPEIYGRVAIRDFRRDLFTCTSSGKWVFSPEIAPHLTVADCAILRQVLEIEPVVMRGFVKLVSGIAEKALFLKRVHGDRDDLIQEGLKIITLSMMGYNGESGLSTYFTYIVTRQFLDVGKHQRRRLPLLQSWEENPLDLPAPTDDDDDEVEGYDMDLLRNAMRCVRLTELEKTVLGLAIEGSQDVYAAAARIVINPKTQKPYTKVAARDAHVRAQEKVTAVYRSLLVRASADTEAA